MKQIEVVIAMKNILDTNDIHDEQEEIKENNKVIDSILTSKDLIASQDDMDMIGISAIIEP